MGVSVQLPYCVLLPIYIKGVIQITPESNKFALKMTSGVGS